ncbi:MAG TPA: zonular occludens toxin domain-containing protein, partial [Ignavibacteriaceae bacterium]|nr:zonular occludens toxin domain-containing protein [Ignavibacteriaceae bacterium]
MKFNIGVEISVELLIKSRLLIQANSGGGKSYAIRKLLEETNGMVQQIVLDLEGEFSSLREKCDFLLFGKDADYPVHIKYADKIAKTLLELNVSAIVDLYELKHHERITFVKRFLDAMINAPKELWHPCLIIIDEAHLFCPEKGQAESMSAVIDICTRGRKRGFCAVLATQRLSKLHKDAAAECNNKLIGRTGLDIDMKRASEELGFTRKEDMLSLRELDAGEFYAFGPAISNRIIKFK